MSTKKRKSSSDQHQSKKRQKEKVPISADVKITNINSSKQEKHAKKRVKNSNFYLLVNTNRAFEPHSDDLDEMAGRFEESMEEISNDLGNYLYIKEPNHSFTRQYFKRIESKSRIELGPKLHRLHCHSIICIQHYSNIHLDLKHIKEKLCEDLGLPNIRLTCRVFRSSARNDIERFDEYISKNMKDE